MSNSENSKSTLSSDVNFDSFDFPENIERKVLDDLEEQKILSQSNEAKKNRNLSPRLKILLFVRIISGIVSHVAIPTFIFSFFFNVNTLVTLFICLPIGCILGVTDVIEGLKKTKKDDQQISDIEDREKFLIKKIRRVNENLESVKYDNQEKNDVRPLRKEHEKLLKKCDENEKKRQKDQEENRKNITNIYDKLNDIDSIVKDIRQAGLVHG